MENSNSITTASTYEELKEFHIENDQVLEPHPECCIYKVPKDLRAVNERAYTPQVISIGPLHHGKKELDDMEEQKIRYKREFRKRISVETWQQLIAFIEVHEQRIRDCYEEMPNLFEKLDFITMVLYDAVFIIELFMRYEEFQTDFLFRKTQVIAAICVDLELLENQLPYFILNGLYMLAFPKPNLDRHIQSYPSFFTLSCLFLFDGMFNEIPEEVEVKHFVDLRRHAITGTLPKPKSIRFIEDFPCAFELRKSGVRFKDTYSTDLSDIRFKKKKLFGIPWLMKIHDELQMPRIVVYDRTEIMIRNVMALEQCHYQRDTDVCNYIALMDHLIKTEKDVNLLIEARIIFNYMGDTARIAKLFDQLCQRIDSSPSCYNDIMTDLKAYYDKPWNAKRTFKSIYFSNFWRGTGTVAATLLLLLTLTQTICSILQVV